MVGQGDTASEARDRTGNGVADGASSAEWWDVLAADGLPTGRVVVRNTSGDPAANLGPGEYHRAVGVCVFDGRGQVLIQQRSADRAVNPGKWDCAGGGSVLAGETSQRAATRELAEEVGIDIDFAGVRPALTIANPDNFFDIYLADAPGLDIGALALQAGEVQAVRWAGLGEVRAMLAEGVFWPYHPSLIDLLFALHERPGSGTG